MRRWIALILLMFAALAPARAQDDGTRYAAGQVWEYRTRAGDKGSLLKIHQIEQTPTGPVYHISLIGLSFGRGMAGGGEFGHMAVSRQTLDASVTRLSASTAPFPDPTEGIAQWRAASGGVFTVPVAEIITNVMAAIADGAGRPANEE